MNAPSATEQNQIFATALEADDLAAVNALVEQHKGNAAVTQQLALDASKLVTATKERLDQQTSAGFFKRLAGAISGKTTQNQLANQVDTLRVQRFAWHYLQQLQQQNLINAQSIAVIRNNLSTMNEYIIETRDFLEQAVDKIDQRLRHVENNVSFANWSRNIEANKRRFKSVPRNLLILRLAYDFMGSHQDVALGGRDDVNVLVTTFDKVDIDCDAEVSLLEFISELIDQVELVGIEQYRDIIALSFDEHVVDGDFIGRNISGLAFNALYFLSEHYERIAGLVGNEELCGSDEARERLISTFFGQEFSGLTTRYSIRDLVCEIIAASQLAIEVYKDQHGLNVVAEEAVEEVALETVALVSSLPDILAHTFLDAQDGTAAKRDYLLLLALCVDTAADLSKPAREFIALLAERAGLPGLHEEVIALADQSGKFEDCRPRLLELLDRDDKKYTWLLDVFFLLTLAGKKIENPKMMVLLGALKPGQLKELLPAMMVLVNESDSSQVLQAGTKLGAQTAGWKNVVRYRALRFEASFADTLKPLDAAGWAGIDLGMALSTAYTKGLEHATFFSWSDGSFLSNAADKASSVHCTMGRKSALAELNTVRGKAREYLSAHRYGLWQANSMLERWNMPAFEFDDKIPHSDFELDNSSGNEDWGDQFQHYHNQVDATLMAFSDACSSAQQQIALFAQGDFDTSVVKIRQQKRAEAALREQQEKLAKQSVTIERDGKEFLFGIEWQQVEHAPCNLDDILHIKTDGKVWVIVARSGSDEVLYRSEDRLHWNQVQLDVPTMKVRFDSITIVNGMWIVKNRAAASGTRAEGIYYSTDALSWQHASAPDQNRGLSYGKIIYFDGIWLWSTIKFQQYSYTEKGFFSDSTKTGSYFKTTVYGARALGGPWTEWEHSPRLPEGVKVEQIHSLPGTNALLAFCEYDWSYMRDKKKPEVPPFIQYFGPRKEWQSGSWDGEPSAYRCADADMFVNVGQGLVHFSSDEVRFSERGYEWRLKKNPLYYDQCFRLEEMMILTSRHNTAAIHVTLDAHEFKELALEEGSWDHLTASAAGIVSVYKQNSYEPAVLRIGNYLCQPKS